MRVWPLCHARCTHACTRSTAWPAYGPWRTGCPLPALQDCAARRGEELGSAARALRHAQAVQVAQSEDLAKSHTLQAQQIRRVRRQRLPWVRRSVRH